jgi:hypothetical protein
MSDILVPVSPGELLDKITILRIKCARIADPAKLANVRLELSQLELSRQQSLPDDAGLAAEEAALERVNQELWDIEDRIREHEGQRRFDADFIALARSVYRRNDERAAIKRRINIRLDSPLVEEKSYRQYD